jgi:chromosome segregation ATPase
LFFQDADVDEIAYKREERALKIEYQSIQMAIHKEHEKQQNLTLRIESSQSAMALQRRAVHATKMKARDFQEKYRQALHWLQVQAKVAFEKEKDRANALLIRATKIFNKFKGAQDNVVTKVNELTKIIEESRSQFKIWETEARTLRQQEKDLTKEVESLREELERLAENVRMKKEMKEQELIVRLQMEESLRQFEQNLLKDACTKQRPGKPVDIEDLEVFEASGKGLMRVPNVKDAIKLSYVDLEGNQLSATRGLDYLKNLTTLNLNVSKTLSDLGNWD